MDVFTAGLNQGNVLVTAVIILGLVIVSSRAKMLDRAGVFAAAILGLTVGALVVAVVTRFHRGGADGADPHSHVEAPAVLSLRVDAATGDYVITWNGVYAHGSTTPNTFQIALSPTGRFTMRWQSVSAAGMHSLVGYSSGLGAPRVSSPGPRVHIDLEISS